jgi:hypothetical protein
MSKRQKRTGMVGIILVIVALAVVGWLRTQPTEAQADSLQALPGLGGAVVVDAPIEIIAANLPVVSAATQTGPVRMHEERHIIPEARYRALKRQAAQPGFGPQLPVTLQAGRPAQPQAGAETPIATINFNGDIQGTAGCGNWVPADQALAVGDGSNPIIQAVNECLSVWSLGGVRLLGPVALQTFFGRPLSESVCDPRALFDWRNHRFIVIAIRCSAPFGAAYVAVSQADNPLGAWWVYTLGSSSSPGAIMDYPRLGQDHTATYPGSGFAGGIYLAYNLFNPGYIHEEWHVLPKGPMYAGAGFTYWYFSGMTSGGIVTDSTQPANVFSPYERPRAEFLLTARNEGVSTNLLTVWAISNPFQHVAGGNAPQLTGVVIGAANSWTLPPDAPQSGGPNNIDTLDNRITGEVTYAHGHLHGAHSTANGAGGTATQIWKIQPFLNRTNAGCALSIDLCPQITGATIRNETVLNYGGTSAAFMAVPQPDLDGNVTTVFNFSTTAEFPSIAYISQRVTQPLATFADSGFYLVNGLGRYTHGRWGDYMAVAPAGIAYRAGNGGITGTNTMVFSGMYSDTTALNRWRTRIGANAFTVPQHYGPQSGTTASAEPLGDQGR